MFPVAHGAPVEMLVSENGKNLSPAQLAKEKVKATSLWRKRKKEFENNKDQAEPKGTIFFFQGLEFSMLRTERYQEREAVVLRFKPRQDFKPANNSEKFASSLEGELWIDAADKAVMKFDAKLAESYKPGLLGHIAPLKPGTSLLIESTQVSNGLWAISKMEFTPVQPGVLFSKSVRYYKQKEEMSDYRPFDMNADDLFAN